MPIRETGRETVHLAERPLEAVSLHFLHAIRENRRGKRLFLAAGCRKYLIAGNYLGLEK